MMINHKELFFLKLGQSFASPPDIGIMSLWRFKVLTGEWEVCAKKTLKGRKIPVHLLIPFENGLIREIQLPWISPRERDSALKYYIQQEIPILLEDFVYDYQITENKEKKYLTVRLTAARKEKIIKYIQAVEKAGYALKGIAYVISALGECLQLDPDKTAILLQTIDGGRIQLVVYQGNKPKIIREIEIHTDDVVKSHIYLALKGYDLPHAFVLTDETPQSERVARFLVDSGLVLEHKRTIAVFLEDQKNLVDIGFHQLALYGESKRIKHKTNENFYTPFLRPLKVKLLAGFVAGILGTILLFTVLIGYPKNSDLIMLEKEVDILQERLLDLDRDAHKITWSTWEKEHGDSKKDLEEIRHISLDFPDSLLLTRINYKQDTLYLWLECKESSKLTALMGNLSASGWREPSLIDYKYTPDKIRAVISVKR